MLSASGCRCDISTRKPTRITIATLAIATAVVGKLLFAGSENMPEGCGLVGVVLIAKNQELQADDTTVSAASAKPCARHTLAEVRSMHLDRNAHLLQPRPHPLADAVAERLFAHSCPRAGCFAIPGR